MITRYKLFVSFDDGELRIYYYYSLQMANRDYKKYIQDETVISMALIHVEYDCLLKNYNKENDNDIR